MFDHLPIATILVTYVAVIFALSVHEAAHATAAYLLEDDTAQRMGRMTLNPIAHMDLLGTVVLPLLGMVTGARVLGWAKPVPVNPSRLTRRFTARVGYAMVAAAGPASNMVQSLLFMILLTLFIRFAVPVDPVERMMLFRASMGVPVEAFLQEPTFSAVNVLAMTLLGRLVIINIGLAIFNLLPFGPLDGAGILRGFLPYQMLPTFDRIQPVITIVLLIAFLFGVMGPLLSPFFSLAEQLYLLPLGRLLLGV
ncbi:MAG: site-2 protease family protein [Holophaga sp.]|nr:site-2 protease family protein [Holophaga sp.]